MLPKNQVLCRGLAPKQQLAPQTAVQNGSPREVEIQGRLAWCRQKKQMGNVLRLRLLLMNRD